MADPPVCLQISPFSHSSPKDLVIPASSPDSSIMVPPTSFSSVSPPKENLRRRGEPRGPPEVTPFISSAGS
ncbi:hypothetical protein Nepgr_021653 [Nepenthes gracilis]|uniref:Uncharacterized protein n=1 Tax=Nepenthes gracilis TaxID=150966 RepID=A0AAD3XW41_NEPGR|nr:hypothetical protein Nepgr_021653 [Nepenthes gracilis]